MPYPIAAAARRRVVRRLEAENATSAETARPLDGLTGMEERRLRRLVELGAIQEAAPGRYWLDLPRYASYADHLRRIKILVVLAVLVGLFFVVELSGRS
jgi:hypothetical protein